MPKSNKRDVRVQRADLRRRTHVPLPEVAEIRQELMRQLTPAMFAQARGAHSHLNLRDRVLNLPVMCAIVLSLVWRQIPSLSEVLRVLAAENLLWVESMKVSIEALSKRFRTLPSELFATLFQQLVTAAATEAAETAPGDNRAADTMVLAPLEQVHKSYGAVWIADGSTLEQLRKTSAELRRADGAVLGGKMLVIVDALSHVPMAAFYQKDAATNEKLFAEQMLAALPQGGLMILDAGFFSFALFDSFSDAGKFFVTRLRAKTACTVVEVLSEGERFRDEIIEMGLHKTPCRHPVRRISVLWGTTWYSYITNELDPERLPARMVALLYRTRWRIEEAFLLCKRLLGLAYLWVGSTNGIEIQIYATLIIYTVLIKLCRQVASALDQPLERISVEMVFRSLYHYSRQIERNPETELVRFLCDNAKLFALVKTLRKRTREKDQTLEDIWDPPLQQTQS
jgi:hypothetical protein